MQLIIHITAPTYKYFIRITAIPGNLITKFLQTKVNIKQESYAREFQSKRMSFIF